jgi:thiol-disulfide isomerase/thioredoxin
MLISALAALALSAGPVVIEDDFSKALAKAKAQKKLLFVDVWAPWCHTCVYMREHVLPTDAVASFERDVVFAAIDSEKVKNEAFLAKYPISVWPTLLFIDPSDGAVRFSWAGSADATQLASLLEAARGQGTLADADAATARGDMADAADRYIKAKPRDGRGVASMLFALYRAKRFDVCAATAVESLAALPRPQDKATVVSWGLGCAAGAEAGSAAKGAPLRALVTEAKALLSSNEVMGDDISSLYESLVDERTEAKDTAGAKALAEAWLTSLEGAAATAATPGQRAAFDAHRVNAALVLGQPARAIDALLLTELQFPTDFNPPARLARLYEARQQWPLATAAIARAVKKNREGPRRICLLRTQAQLAKASGNALEQRRVAQEALANLARLPASPLKERCAAGLEALAQVDSR